MRKMTRVSLLLLSLGLILTVALPASAQVVGGNVSARLRAFDEVPALSASGVGHFRGTIEADGSEMSYELDYANVQGTVTQAHIHFAQKGVNGGIVIFLCSNLPNKPAGVQACPPLAGEVSGTATAANVGNGAASQGITTGEFGSVLRAIRAGMAYVNVHTDVYPGGAIRGQIVFTPED